MKKPEQLSQDLQKHDWPKFSNHPFIDEVLFKTVFDQVKDDEQVLSQLWGVRLNEQGEQTSQFELLTLTDNHLISVYSDLDNEQDKVHVFSQTLSKVDKFSHQPSTLHKGYVRINLVLDGITWSLESHDLKTADHFSQELDKHLIKTRHEIEKDVTTSLLNEDVSNPNLKTVQTSTIKKNSKKTHEWSKKNLNMIKKYAKNNILWYSLIVFSAFFLITISSTYIIIVNEYTGGLGGVYLAYSLHRKSLVVAGAFAIIFSAILIASYIMLTIKTWDKENFSRNLYRILIQLAFSVIILIFGFLMAINLSTTAWISAIYMLPMAIYLLIDSTYLLVKAIHDLKTAKKVK